MSEPDEKLDRREFFRGIGRKAAAAALALAGGALAARSIGSQASETCRNSGVCRGCPAFDDGCGLPQALSLRDAQGKQKQ